VIQIFKVNFGNIQYFSYTFILYLINLIFLLYYVLIIIINVKITIIIHDTRVIIILFYYCYKPKMYYLLISSNLLSFDNMKFTRLSLLTNII